ncbi:hypothetical protein ACHQM5_019234 [Ranunculus cassubicifolius]
MIDQQHNNKESMEKNSVGSLRYLQSKAFYPKLYDGRNAVDGSEVKEEISAQTGGATVKHNIYASSDTFFYPYENYQGPIHQQDVCMFSTFVPDYQRLQLSQLGGFDGQIYSMNNNYALPVENQYQYTPFGMFYQNYQYEMQFQDFQYFVVIDFEATCDKENNPNPQEIIEFPSVLVNSMTGQLEASFQTYVRPAYHQNLTDFCKELTGIQQIQVDRGVPLSEALLMHDKWLEEKGIKHTKFAVVTWSNWDCRVMLENECRFKKIRKPPYFNKWINLKVPFQEVFGGVRCNLKDAVQLAGLAWEGRAHCGLDDARNTARLLSYLMHRGFKLFITNSLMFNSADQSIPLQHSSDGSTTHSYYPYTPVAQPVDSSKARPISKAIKITSPLTKIQGRTTKIEPSLQREVAYVISSKVP